ncbi:MAG TPA: ABC transporter ATP-binding protein [Turneriella sp.]|nr:ABC transporter ATP-binding protein [Turneriella sp.]
MLVIVMATMELVGIASIGPFMALVGDMNLINTNATLQKVYALSGLTSPKDFLFFSGLTVLFLLGFSALVSIVTTWRLSFYGFAVGTEMSNRLYRFYLQRDWLFHVSSSSSQLINHVQSETSRVTHGILLPMLQLNARVALAVFIGVSLFVFNPWVAILGLLVFSSGYFIVYKLVKNRLMRYDKNLSRASEIRYRLMIEGFGGIKDILMLQRGVTFTEEFANQGVPVTRTQALISAIGQIPRYFMEFLAFCTMVSLILVLVRFYNGDLSTVLPLIAIYGLAGFKLLPALQQIYASVVTMKGNAAAFHAIKDDLKSALLVHEGKMTLNSKKIDLVMGSIQLKDVSFTYPTKSEPALIQANIIIPANSTVGLVGATGSGKSTAIDLVMALILPQKGSLLVGGVPITVENREAWQRQIGFVPQSIFLTEGTIAENVAFGLRVSEIDAARVNRALQLAHLADFIATLPEGIQTKVGERGVRLSGGQRQRIGIARALYNDTKVLVFDEATSALDGITEKIIMNAIDELSGERTIILIAHRLKTVMNSDIIYILEGGRVVDSGTYRELVDKNVKFREMALNA